MVFALPNDQLYPNHWTFNSFSTIFIVMSFAILIVKASSSILNLQPCFILRFSFTQLHRLLAFFIMAFLMVKVDFITIWFRYLIALTSLSIFFSLLLGTFKHVFLTLRVPCSSTFQVFLFLPSIFLVHVPFPYDVLFPIF